MTMNYLISSSIFHDKKYLFFKLYFLVLDWKCFKFLDSPSLFSSLTVEASAMYLVVITIMWGSKGGGGGKGVKTHRGNYKPWEWEEEAAPVLMQTQQTCHWSKGSTQRRESQKRSHQIKVDILRHMLKTLRVVLDDSVWSIAWASVTFEAINCWSSVTACLHRVVIIIITFSD